MQIYRKSFIGGSLLSCNGMKCLLCCPGVKTRYVSETSRRFLGFLAEITATRKGLSAA